MDKNKIYNEIMNMGINIYQFREYPKSDDFYIEVKTNKISVAEKVLDKLEELLANKNYHLGLKTIEKYWEDFDDIISDEHLEGYVVYGVKKND